MPILQPTISVRIPTKNRANLLRDRSLPSVIYQTYTKIEIVIVGDFCIDNTDEIINSFRNRGIKITYKNLPVRSDQELELIKDPEIRWFMGPVRATNAATELCKGEWIAHLDDDDIWTPDHIEVLLGFALKNNYDFVSSKYIRKRYGKFEEVDGEEINGQKVGGCQTWLYKTELAKQFPYDSLCYRKRYNRVSDIDVAERLVLSGARMGFYDHPTAYVLPRPGKETVGLEAYKK